MRIENVYTTDEILEQLEEKARDSSEIESERYWGALRFAKFYLEHDNMKEFYKIAEANL